MPSRVVADILRVNLKNLIVWLGLGSWLIEYCELCGVAQPVLWHASNVLWQVVAGRYGYKVLCPGCFDEQAEWRKIPLAWEVRERMPVVELKEKKRVQKVVRRSTKRRVQ